MNRLVKLYSIALLMSSYPALAQSSAVACGDACHADILAKAGAAALGTDLTLLSQAVSQLRADVLRLGNTPQIITVDVSGIADNQNPYKCTKSGGQRAGLVTSAACLTTDTFCTTLNRPASTGVSAIQFRTLGTVNKGQEASFAAAQLICEVVI